MALDGLCSKPFKTSSLAAFRLFLRYLVVMDFCGTPADFIRAETTGMAGMLKGFGRRPLARRLGEPPGAGFESLARRKPRGRRALFGGCSLWGFLGRQQIACVGAQPDGAQW